MGVKSVTRAGTTALAAGDILTGQVALVEYDGTQFQLLDPNSFTNLRVSNSLSLAGDISLTGDISPTTLSANTDNWAPTGFSTASTIRMAATAAWNLTGIAAGADGRTILLHNISAYSITLKDDATSTAGNRFLLNGDYILGSDSSVMLQYDATSSRWRLFGQQEAAAITTSVSFNRLVNNVGIAVTMAANAVTIALKGADGTDPSASNICTIGFRHATLTTGQVNQRQVTAALSTVISSGSTGGSVSAAPVRVWVGAIDVSGTVELAWFATNSSSQAVPIDEGGVISTTAEGGAGAADLPGTWYSTTARTSVPVTIIAYFDSTQATAGTWVTSPSLVVINPPHNLSNTVIGSATVTTSGTSVDINGLPTGIKEVMILFNGVSSNGTSPYLIQIGPVAGVESATYSSQCSSRVTTGTSTAGFRLDIAAAAASVYNGIIFLALANPSNNTWVCEGSITDGLDTVNPSWTAGAKAIAGPLTNIRLTTAGGANTFDLGAITVVVKF